MLSCVLPDKSSFYHYVLPGVLTLSSVSSLVCSLYRVCSLVFLLYHYVILPCLRPVLREIAGFDLISVSCSALCLCSYASAHWEDCVVAPLVHQG